MEWEWEEDVIVCNYYLDNVFDPLNQNRINDLMIQLNKAGFHHPVGSVRMRVANYKFIDRGVGLSHPSEQSKAVYAHVYKIKMLSKQKPTKQQNSEQVDKNKQLESYLKMKVVVGSVVKHKKFGLGKVDSLDSGYVYVLFDNNETAKCFKFPRAFIDDILVLE